MSAASWRQTLLRRLAWSLGAASLWTWGLLLLRMVRDGLQPLEVWFSYGLAFFMTAVYVYLGLLIYATVRAEGGAAPEAARPDPARAERLRRPAAVLGTLGAALALASVIGWLALRYPGPQAVPGTIANVILVLMILGVVIVSTLIARGAR